MKEIFIGTVIILVLGIGGFLYRNTFEHPYIPLAPATPCTTEAKLCPDGQSVGRSGANCTFAVCPLPNAEDPAIGIAFVIPNGYSANADAIGADESLRAVFDKSANGQAPSSIIIRRYMIEAGKTANETILSHTMFKSPGEKATSMKQFTSKIIGGKTFFCTQLERFEGHIHTACYLARANDVLRFEVLEKDVLNWTDANLKVDELPEHRALYLLLEKLSA